MIIRDATYADLEDIIAIYNSTISGRMVTADIEPLSIKDREEWFKEHNPGSRPLWVVEEEDKIVAWVSFQSFYGRPAYRHTAELSIYIAEGYRGQGLGEQLLQEAMNHCEKIDVKTLLGFIFGHNKPSLGLIEKHGFERWGHFPRVAVLDGVERDLIIMGKRIRE
jgi:phosphinothricin acetyltransferase